MIEFISLENKDTSRLVDGVIIYPLKVNKDSSGVLVETLRKDWPQIYGKDREFAMQYCSVTPPNLARDENVWHHHNNQEDRFIVVDGSIVTAIGDNRENSPTKGLLNLFSMSSESPYILLIPKRTLHGFMVVSEKEAILLNFPTELYNKEDELRIPHEEAGITFADGSPFSWDRIRKEFQGNG